MDQKLFFAEIQTQINLFSGTNELKALQQICNFVHSEYLLLAMGGNENKIVRAKAVNVILKNQFMLKEERKQEFHLPRCKFAATSCTDLIILKGNDSGNGATYLTHKKYLALNEPRLIKSCADI